MTPIRPLEIDVVGIHPRYPRLLVLRMSLTPAPAAAWQEAFLQAFVELPDQPMFLPTIADAVVTLMPPDDRMEVEVTLVQHAIRLANQRCAEFKSGAHRRRSRSGALSGAVALEAMSPEAKARFESAAITAERLSGQFDAVDWGQGPPQE